MTKDLAIVVLAHNEERRIGICLASLPTTDPAVAVHVVVNGSTDRTAEIARSFAGVTVHEYKQGGKSRSWNRIMLGEGAVEAGTYIFVDGDAEVCPGSVSALAECLAANPRANAASGFPRNGRKAEHYAEALAREHGLFGDLYALSGRFVALLRERGIRLPEDLIGDDGLLCAMAKTDARDESHWDDSRVVPCTGAGFLCEPTALSPASLHGQYKRMVNYSLRHFQNRIITRIMREEGGPEALPPRLADRYAEWLPRWQPRRDPVWWWFDRQALKRMRGAI